jgi:hypothetical protein
MTKNEITALLLMVEHQNRLLTDYAARIQEIETFLREQPATASLFHSAANGLSAAETESNLQSSVQVLEKALSGRP